METNIETKLTKREIEVAQLVADGYKNSEIAEKLCITTRTVKAHLENIFYKLKINNRVQLAILYYLKQLP